MRPPRDLAVGIGSDLPFQLHETSDPAAVYPEVRFDVGSRLETVATSTPGSSATLVRFSRHVASPATSRCSPCELSNLTAQYLDHGSRRQSPHVSTVRTALP
jgi:hypothetical protein